MVFDSSLAVNVSSDLRLDSKGNSGQNLKCLKENLKIYKQQTKINNEVNEKSRQLLKILAKSQGITEHSQLRNVLKSKSNSNKENFYLNCNQKKNLQDRPEIYSNINKNVSVVNPNLIEYIKYRKNYLQHVNYWQQIWIFTENPIYEYVSCEGFENPSYSYLNVKAVFDSELDEKLSPCSQDSLFSASESSISKDISVQSSIYLNHRFKNQQNLFQHSSVMNLYEKILDSNNLVNSASIPAILTEINNKSKQLSDRGNPLSNSGITPDSTDSGIHSEESIGDRNINNQKKSCLDSLYSNIQTNGKEKNLDSVDDRHLEQNELPLGWIRCCDDDGIYYWHKPSGTVTRKPPIGNNSLLQTIPQVPKKNFKIDEYSSIDKISDLVSNNSPVENTYVSGLSSSSSASNTSSAEASYNYEEQLDSYSSAVSLCGEAVSLQRFYVRSLGWVRIDENDLTPELSSKAVNRCINELSRGRRDLNDVVASWGEGKDLYLDLEESNLILVDSSNGQILNKQSVTSIRIWGVGRDNGRDFAYVARDKQTKMHMCHVFRCDSAPAKEIANSLRDTCRRIMSEKNSNKVKTKHIIQTQLQPISNRFLKRSDLNDSETRSTDFSRYKSVSCHDQDQLNQTQIPKSQTHLDNLRLFQSHSSTEEPKKTMKCRYLGSTTVAKPSGMETLNEAIEKVYLKSLKEFKRVKKENRQKNAASTSTKIESVNFSSDDEEDYNDNYDYPENSFTFDMLDLHKGKSLGVEVKVIVTPSTVIVQDHEFETCVECRLRYLSFMGISNDVRLSGFIMHCIDNTFKCHVFLSENSSANLMQMIETACRLRYQKCLDAHPEAARDGNISGRKQTSRFGNFGSQLRGMFDSLKNLSIIPDKRLPELQ